VFIQLLSVLRHLDGLLDECWFCQSWRLPLAQAVLLPGCFGSSLRDQSSVNQQGKAWRRLCQRIWWDKMGKRGLGSLLYGVTDTPESWSLDFSKHKCTRSWPTGPVSSLRAAVRVAHRITHHQSAILARALRGSLENRSQSLHQF